MIPTHQGFDDLCSHPASGVDVMRGWDLTCLVQNLYEVLNFNPDTREKRWTMSLGVL